MTALQLSGIGTVGFGSEGKLLFRVSTNPNRPVALRKQEAFLVRGNIAAPIGFGAYIVMQGPHSDGSNLPVPRITLPEDFAYLDDGDVVRIDVKRDTFRTLYRRSSNHNSFLLTERCNHYCLMCSQPPKDIQDGWLADEIIAALKLIDPGTQEIGLTGGEPTLLGQRFLDILAAAKAYLPRTSVHVLTNGRAFIDKGFCEKIRQIAHPDLMFGVPLYADIASKHDYIVQSNGAFDETIRGILNIKESGQRVELRFVITALNHQLLPRFADFVGRNLLFVDQVSLMGMEVVGFARANLAELWIDPFDYKENLAIAVQRLAAHQLKTHIFNHQLCVVDRSVWSFCRKSISDWKNEHLELCDECSVRENCGGFFSTGRTKYSAHLRPFPI